MVWALMKRKLCVCVLRLCLTELEHKSEDICIWRFFLSSHCCYICIFVSFLYPCEFPRLCSPLHPQRRALRVVVVTISFLYFYFSLRV